MIEKTFILEFSVHLFERKLQSSSPLRFEFSDIELILSTWDINVNVPLSKNEQAVIKLELEFFGVTRPHNTRNHSIFIFYRKIAMAATVRFKITEFTLDGQTRGQNLLKCELYKRIELAWGVNFRIFNDHGAILTGQKTYFNKSKALNSKKTFNR
jgi:hypothetical protein